MSLILPPPEKQEPETFLQKYKYYFLVGFIAIAIAVIVLVSLWMAGVFDSKSSDNIPDDLSEPKSGPLQLIFNQNNLAGIENTMSSSYSEDSIVYHINWPIGTLRYKDVEGISSDVFFPEITHMFDGPPAQIPALIPKTAGEYGPYITKSKIIITLTNNKGAAGVVGTPKIYPAGSIFGFKVDNKFNITYYFHLSQSGMGDYLNTHGMDRFNEMNGGLQIKANPLNLNIMDGTVGFSI
jgi:hypothetical protein